jgi:hypothetical protein
VTPGKIDLSVLDSDWILGLVSSNKSARYWVMSMSIVLAAMVVAALITALYLGNNAREQLDQVASVLGLLITLLALAISLTLGQVAQASATPQSPGRVNRWGRVLLSVTVALSVLLGVIGTILLDRASAREKAVAASSSPTPSLWPSSPVLAGTPSPVTSRQSGHGASTPAQLPDLTSDPHVYCVYELMMLGGNAYELDLDEGCEDPKNFGYKPEDPADARRDLYRSGNEREPKKWDLYAPQQPNRGVKPDRFKPAPSTAAPSYCLKSDATRGSIRMLGATARSGDKACVKTDSGLAMIMITRLPLESEGLLVLQVALLK